MMHMDLLWKTIAVDHRELPGEFLRGYIIPIVNFFNENCKKSDGKSFMKMRSHQIQISRRNFVNHLDENTNILDVPFHIMGTLVGVAQQQDQKGFA